MNAPAPRDRLGLRRALAEPLVHFLVLGALLFVAHRLIVGDSRSIVVSAGVRADLERRFRDNNHGRAPTAAELSRELRTWERDEALYREALRDRLDRNDSTIRALLADRVRARVALGVPPREPSPGELDAWLAAHRNLYEEPLRYEYEAIAFPKNEPSAQATVERFQQALARGVEAKTLIATARPGFARRSRNAGRHGNPSRVSISERPIVGATLTADELAQRLGAELAARVRTLPIGQWQRLDSDGGALLVRLVSVAGGLPPPDELHQRMLVDWRYDDHQRRVEQALAAIVDRYRFEERP